METILPATAEDIPALVNLLTLLFTQEADFHPDRGKQERGLRLLLESPATGIIFVAHEADQVVGMVSLLYTISTAEGGRACWLEDLVVREDRRGSSIGSRLLKAAVDHARAQGVVRITLLTDQGNEGAIRFYLRHGFEPSRMRALRIHL